MARTATMAILTVESGLTRYFEQIRRFPLLEPQDEYMFAKRWREHGDGDAAHRLVTSHLRLVAKIAMGYRGYGLPISEVISEGNVGLMQAVKRFEPEKGFRFATYALWWIKAAIQEYILRSWSLVKLGTTANQKKLFFNLRKAKSKISALDEGDLRPDQVKIIARRLGVTEQDVVDMNRRLGGDVSLNAPIREEGDSGEWQDWLVDEISDQETRLAESEEADNRRKALGEALTVLNERERRIFEARRLADDPIILGDLASEFGVSRERVRQIEVRAFEKVQKAVKNRVAAIETSAPLPVSSPRSWSFQPLDREVTGDRDQRHIAKSDIEWLEIGKVLSAVKSRHRAICHLVKQREMKLVDMPTRRYP
jgi:RNA polymerase sigma-32 factor